MNNGKKWLQIAIASSLVITVLSACNSSKSASSTNESAETEGTADETKAADASAGAVNPTGFPIVAEPISITMMGAQNANHGEWKDMKVFQEYAKKTNINVEWVAVPENAFEEKRNIALASGDLPDAFYRARLTPYDEVNYGSQGVFIPLNSIIDEYAPNIKAMFETYPEIKKAITAPDGNIYTLPQVANYLAPRIGNKQWINKKWLDKLGLPVPTTTEEYFNTLKAFKEQDPNGNGVADEIPWSGDKSFNLLGNLLGSWGLATTGMRNANVDLGPDGKLRFYTADPRYKELLEYMANLYSEGLLDKEAFTQESAQWYAKGFEGIIGATGASNTNYVMGPDYMDDYVPVPALVGPHGDHLYIHVNPLTQAQGTFAITNKNEHPEATIRWVDYFYSEEGSKFFRMGIEDETYTTLADGNVQYTDLIIRNPQGLSLDQAIGQYSPWPGGGLPQLIYEKYDKTGNSLPSSLAAAALLEPDIPETLFPSFLFTKEEQDRLNALTSDINTYVEEMRVKFITGAIPFTEWDAYVGTLKKMGSDQLVEIYEAAYERYKNS